MLVKINGHKTSIAKPIALRRKRQNATHMDMYLFDAACIKNVFVGFDAACTWSVCRSISLLTLFLNVY